MLSRKKPAVSITSTRVSRKGLEQLYARRSALDNLIHSLEEYDRHRAKHAVLAHAKKSA